MFNDHPLVALDLGLQLRVKGQQEELAYGALEGPFCPPSSHKSSSEPSVCEACTRAGETAPHRAGKSPPALRELVV